MKTSSLSTLNSQLSTRYSRQTMLPEFGEEGQKRLAKAKVLLVGVGGLGSPVALYLAGAGVGRIGLVDSDVVSESNLQRQVLYTESEVGQLKVECAKKRLSELNSTITIDCYPVRFEKENAEEIAASYDLIIDGCDNFKTRYLLDEISAKLNIPYIYGSIGEFKGQVSVFNYKNGCRYRDLYPLENQTSFDKPVMKGVLGPVPGVIGTLEAIEAIKIITNIGNPLRNRLLTVNLLTMEIMVLEVEE
jgi:adenylyltransferase/sulfurtransferase